MNTAIIELTLQAPTIYHYYFYWNFMFKKSLAIYGFLVILLLKRHVPSLVLPKRFKQTCTLFSDISSLHHPLISCLKC